MNAGLAHTLESLFGPPSEAIDISDFLESAVNEVVQDACSSTIPEIAEECRWLSSTATLKEFLTFLSVEEIRGLLTNTWNNPTLSGHLIRDHDRIVSALHSAATSRPKSIRKTQLPHPEALSAEVNTLQNTLDNISLKSFRFCFYRIYWCLTQRSSGWMQILFYSCEHR